MDVLSETNELLKYWKGVVGWLKREIKSENVNGPTYLGEEQLFDFVEYCQKEPYASNKQKDEKLLEKILQEYFSSWKLVEPSVSALKEDLATSLLYDEIIPRVIYGKVIYGEVLSPEGILLRINEVIVKIPEEKGLLALPEENYLLVPNFKKCNLAQIPKKTSYGYEIRGVMPHGTPFGISFAVDEEKYQQEINAFWENAEIKAKKYGKFYSEAIEQLRRVG
ncbi:MAG: hypothetical protein GXN99_01535 [Candidatus Nanohaloarchaeota archaeon]|nr:hypothetical protein [Candidatus Nanohaloarchaeota archaeon]